MRTVYVKTGDFNTIFATVKLQAFTAGYQELNDFLHQAQVDKHGRIDAGFWNSEQFDRLDRGDRAAYKEMEKQGKVIARQARELGVTVQYNDVGSMNLRGLI